MCVCVCDVFCKVCVCIQLLSRVRLFLTPWAGLPHCRQILHHLSHQGSPVPGDLPDPGTEPASLKSPELAGGSRYFFIFALLSNILGGGS